MSNENNSLPTPIPSALETVAEKLSNPQRQALSALIAGHPVVAAAQSAGVHRSTLHRWINSDPLFAAAYNAIQHEARESTRVKLLSVVQDALSNVTSAIQSGDKRLAYNLLKDLGLLTKLKPGQTNPDLLRVQIQIDEARQKLALDAEAEKLGLNPE